MEENSNKLKSIWGSWWEPVRKWFYPAWLIYETTVRFYAYTIQVHDSIIDLKFHSSDSFVQITAILAGVITFAICFAFLTVPASIALFRFFKSEKITTRSLERKLKTYL